MIPPRRRGGCPSLASPMPTGDGLLARLTPTGATIPLDAIAALCAAARRHGSGIVEITSRGSIQVRGLTPVSAQKFAGHMAASGLDVATGVPVAASPLAGLEAGEVIDALALSETLRDAIHGAALNGRLAPKVSVVIDGGGALHLDALAADVRLRAEAGSDGARVHVLLGGDLAAARHVGSVAPGDAAQAVLRLLAVLAARGPAARARDVMRAEGGAPFEYAIAALSLEEHSPPPLRPRAEPIGLHRLRDGRFALGLGLAFGHADAHPLESLATAAGDAQACGVRPAPDRALLIIGLPPEFAPALAAHGEQLGFVTRADDPRRSIAACPGAPFCACTKTPTRTLAPTIATAAAPLFDGSVMLHLSGCEKGCAHQGPAALTIVGNDGQCDVVLQGAAYGQALAALGPKALPASLARLARAVGAARLADERAAAVLSRLGAAEVAAILAEPRDG